MPVFLGEEVTARRPAANWVRALQVPVRGVYDRQEQALFWFEHWAKLPFYHILCQEFHEDPVSVSPLDTLYCFADRLYWTNGLAASPAANHTVISLITSHAIAQ